MNKKKYTRKDFLEAISTATVGSLALGMGFPSVAKSFSNHDRTSLPFELSQGATILFQGDSITDAGRNREILGANNQSGLGPGYAFLAAAPLLHEQAGKHLKCYNRGISGNKVFQLADRWERDCLSLKPDVLSILIGVNDFWHTLNGDYEGTPEIYEKDFRALLKRTKKALPEVTLIIGEPYVVKEGSAITPEWFPEFIQYQTIAKQIARDFDAAFIPYQSIYDKAGKKVSSTYWTIDGVHPSTAGCQLMAQAWIETLKRL